MPGVGGTVSEQVALTIVAPAELDIAVAVVPDGNKEHDVPFKNTFVMVTVAAGPGLDTTSFKVLLADMNVACDTISLACADVEATNVVYMYQPTATAITIIIANSIANSIEVSPFIRSLNDLVYKNYVALFFN